MASAPRPLVIAHRGASGYLPEHTLVAKALAFGQGADCLEQDVVATRDDELIVFHDLWLESTTDVATRFPGRQRADGHYYCRDFDLAELQELGVGPRMGDDGRMLHPGRFPAGNGRFRIRTLGEEILFIQGLVLATGRNVALYPEIKEPSWHQAEGIDIGMQLLAVLEQCQSRGPRLPVFLQCFDRMELRRLSHHRRPGTSFIQLISSRSGAPSAEDLQAIAGHAQGIGPSLRLLLRQGSDGRVQTSTLVQDAHATGLVVHPYTFRADDLPEGIGSFEELLELCIDQLQIDGLFTDFPDLARQFIDRSFRTPTASFSG